MRMHNNRSLFGRVYVCVCVCVCVYVCMYVCMDGCMYVYVCAFIQARPSLIRIGVTEGPYQ